MHFHGRLDNYLGIGVNNLIKEGAILTTKVEDILNYYPQFLNKMCKRDEKFERKHEKEVQIMEREKKSEEKKERICNDLKIIRDVHMANNIQIKEEYSEIYNLIKNGNYFLDEIILNISNSNNNNISNIIEILSKMEIEGIIKRNSSGGYSIID